MVPAINLSLPGPHSEARAMAATPRETAAPAAAPAGSASGEEAMMDLREVQQFLFMMIGTKVQVVTESNLAGARVDTCA